MNDRTDSRAGGASPGGMGITDIYYILFRWKWLILFFCALGVAGAVTICIIKPPRYRSEAQILIKYVVETKSLNPPGDDSDTLRLNTQEASILDTEGQIIRSRDVAERVVTALGPEKILAAMGGGNNPDAAADVVQGYMHVQLPARGSVITVEFQHPDPKVAREVLASIIVAYIDKHKEMRQPAGAFGDFLNQETMRLREQLAATERQLKEAKLKAGVVSLDDEKKAYVQQKTSIREDLFNAQAELAGHQAALGQMTNMVLGELETTNAEPQVPLEQVIEYKNVCARLDLFSKREQDLLTQLTAESSPVKDVQRQIAETLQMKKRLEKDYPALASLVMPSRSLGGQRSAVSIDPAVEAIQIRALKSKIEVLNTQLVQLQNEAARIDEMEDTIRELQRKKELVETELKYFSGTLEQSRVEETLGAGKAPNIATIQPPTPPAKGWSQPFKKKLSMLTGGCMATGFALAFLIELFLDRTVRRPIEVTTKLRLPLLISIPRLGRNGSRRRVETPERRPAPAPDETRVTIAKAPADASRHLPILAVHGHDPLRRFYEGLRDRLVVYFDVRNLTHKPKLVAVTSCSKGAGVSSIAAGLAASLSETTDGNVLLVDMNAEQGSSRQFHRGNPDCRLIDALSADTKESALVKANLYVASEPAGEDSVSSVLPVRLTSLVPQLKASDYDYVIFDMPPVSQTSVTARAARMMDMVLLVIESGKTNRDAVQHASSLLLESKANVSAVLNKFRSYIPARLHQELLVD